MFKHTKGNAQNIQHNQLHQLAIRHAMLHFDSGAIYTFIPKNACSTMRLSLAISNGMISDVKNGNWIHGNNTAFIPSLKEAYDSQYKYVILRCPFERLASFFLDKIVAKEPEAWALRNICGRQFELDDLTFETFVDFLSKPNVISANIHWRSQADFLLYENYDRYFDFSFFDGITAELYDKVGLRLIDARELTGHGISGYTIKEDQGYSKVNVFELMLMKRSHEVPSYRRLYSQKVIEVVGRLYADDVALYQRNCKGSTLF